MIMIIIRMIIVVVVIKQIILISIVVKGQEAIRPEVMARRGLDQFS